MTMVAQEASGAVVLRKTVNEDKAKDGLAKIVSALTEASELEEKIKSQLELIPQKNGTRDQLGENVEQYITEIDEKVDSNIVQQLETIVNSEATILVKAKKLDDEDYNRRKRQAEKRANAIMEQ